MWGKLASIAFTKSRTFRWCLCSGRHRMLTERMNRGTWPYFNGLNSQLAFTSRTPTIWQEAYKKTWFAKLETKWPKMNSCSKKFQRFTSRTFTQRMAAIPLHAWKNKLGSKITADYHNQIRTTKFRHSSHGIVRWCGIISWLGTFMCAPSEKSGSCRSSRVSSTKSSSSILATNSLSWWLQGEVDTLRGLDFWGVASTTKVTLLIGSRLNRLWIGITMDYNLNSRCSAHLCRFEAQFHSFGLRFQTHCSPSQTSFWIRLSIRMQSQLESTLRDFFRNTLRRFAFWI